MLIDNPNNLYTTWEVLASEEVKFIWGFALHEKQKYNSVFDLYLGDLQNKALLQGYVQQCIEERSWAWEIETGFINNNRTYHAAVTPGGISGNDPDYEAEYEKPSGIALLIAYIKALAAQRAIAEGQWQNFKGDVIEVVEEGFSGWPAGKEDVYFYEKRYVSFSIENQIYYANGDDFGDLVFYKHKDQNLATKKHDFLGLVDWKHPESEGLLKFTAVAK